MQNKKYLWLSGVAIFMLAACNNGGGSSSGGGGSITPGQAEQTAPAIPMTVQPQYQTNGQYDVNKFIVAQEGFNKLGEAIRNQNINPNQFHTRMNANINSSENIPIWDSAAIYATPGNKVLFTQGNQTGVFSNAWWTSGDVPVFEPNYGPWRLVETVASESDPAPVLVIPEWSALGQYTGGYTVHYTKYNKCYKSQWWTQNNEPPQVAPTQTWENPWIIVTCPNTDEEKESAIDGNQPGGVDDIDDVPSQGEESTPIEDLTPVPESTPIIPVEVPESTPAPVIPPTPIVVESQLPSAGYTLLRKLTVNDWDWYFPLSYGKSNESGGTYNNPPYTTNPGDVFTLASFKKAVLEYNAYAAKHNYKQFLNDGNLKQQAEEFAAFMSNVSRETSGSWTNAPAPWIVDYNISGVSTKLWKGGLYWVQEVGYETNPDGTSPHVGYIDAASEWKPVQGRSYHGRGPIQLSWNYNYGAFSAWLYDNGLYAEKITSRDTLLKNPGLVNSDPVVSMLSAIWFWMTPQGPKPSAHDVIYGAVSNISRSSLETGLPPMNNGGTPPSANGDSSDADIVAYRIGTTINIINGGIECNKASAWHYGPPQRASYYNAYAAHLNQQYNAGATLVPAAINIWNDKISASDPVAKQSATCYNQKSYYGY